MQVKKKQQGTSFHIDALSPGSQLATFFKRGDVNDKKEGQTPQGTPLSLSLPVSFSAAEKSKETAVGLWGTGPDSKSLVSVTMRWRRVVTNSACS